MRRIIYTSRAAPDLDRAELFRLLYQARLANEARGMSGVLVQCDGRFLQVLEGPTWKLFAAFETIRQDLRHRDVEVVCERSIPEATFPAWPMRYFDERSLEKGMVLMSEAAGGTLPGPIAAAIRDFLITAPRVSLSPPAAVQPSSPRPC
ncbi:MAG: BLUF domain-containing protein [Erythrobacter sp.]